MNEEWGFDSQQRQEIFFSTEFRLAFGLTQPSIQWVPGDLPLDIEQPGNKLTFNLHLVLRLRLCGAIPSLPYTFSWYGA
jgi:hypothetical protein